MLPVPQSGISFVNPRRKGTFDELHRTTERREKAPPGADRSEGFVLRRRRNDFPGTVVRSEEDVVCDHPVLRGGPRRRLPETRGRPRRVRDPGAGVLPGVLRVRQRVARGPGEKTL